MHDIHKLGASGAVHRTVMHLHQECKTPRRVALDVIEPFDDVDFPHGFIAPQWLRVNAGSQNAQLAPVSGFR